jgi:urease accessory protein
MVETAAITEDKKEVARALSPVGTVLGNSAEVGWANRLEGAEIDELLLDQWEAQKSRLRRFTRGGVEIAIVLDRGTQLHDGDVLAWDEAGRRAVVARITLNDVMVVDVGSVTGASPEVVVQTCIELGHAIGNQHWPAIVKGASVYVPLTVDRAVMASVMKTHAFERVTYTFIPGEDVIPYLAPHEARLLFGGAGREGHGHRHPPPDQETQR